MRPKVNRYFVGDFETTVYDKQEDTEVWASAVVEMFDDDVKIHHSIGETFDYLVSLNSNIVIYYHNLKFDGSFWLSYLMINLGFEQAVRKLDGNEYQVEWLRTKDMRNNTFKYVISDMGQWYSITIKVKGHTIEIQYMWSKDTVTSNKLKNGPFEPFKACVDSYMLQNTEFRTLFRKFTRYS